MKESETVVKDQPLVVLAATASEVDVEELQVRIDSQIIKSIRLEAEINIWCTNFPFWIAREKTEDSEQIDGALFESKDNFEGNIKEINAQIEKVQVDVDILLRQAEMSEELMKEQVTSEFAHLNILKELNTAKGQLESLIEKRKTIKGIYWRLKWASIITAWIITVRGNDEKIKR